MADKATFASVIKNRGFLNLWVNQILVQLSYNSLNFALIIWVFRLTDSNSAVSALLFSVYFPAVLFSIFAGVLVDITDRKKIILGINFLLTIAFFCLIFVKESYWAVLAVAFFINSVVQFYGPAESSSIPIIVKKNQLIVANSIFSATLYSCFLLGFGLAGPLINHLGIDFVFGIGAVFLAVAFASGLNFPSIKTDTGEQGEKLILALRKKDYPVIYKTGLNEILQTMKLIKGRLPLLSSIAILAGVQMVIGTVAVLAPGFFEKTLHIKATDASYVVVIPLGLGIVAGGLILGRVGQSLVKRSLVAKAILFAGILFLLEGATPVISPAIRYFHRPKPLSFITQPSLASVIAVGSFLLGFAVVSILVPSQTVLQENTPDEDRGKVFAVLGVAMAGMSIIPVILAGLLADMFGTTPIFIGLGIIILTAGLFGLNPSFFFSKSGLSFRVREFLGLGHWERE